MGYLEKKYEVERILWGGGTKSYPKRLVRWRDYSHRGDTWEARTVVEDQPALTVFESLTPSLLHTLFFFRDGLYRFCASLKIDERDPVDRKDIFIDAVRDAETGRNLLNYLAEESGV